MPAEVVLKQCQVEVRARQRVLQVGLGPQVVPVDDMLPGCQHMYNVTGGDMLQDLELRG